MKRTKLIVICFLFFYSNQIWAETGTGCLLDGTNIIYTNFSCTLGVGSLCVGKHYPASNNPHPYSTAMNCFSFSQTSTRCGTGIVSGLLLPNGWEVDYNSYFPCPIDGHTWLLLAATGTFGVFVIRKKR